MSKNPTLDEMISRVPDKEYLTTRDVQIVMRRPGYEKAHEVTVYRWVAQGKLRAFRVATRGKANIFRREDVIAFIRARFETDTGSGEHGGKTPKVGRRRRRGRG